MQRWQTIQHELMPELRNAAGALTPKLEQVVHTLEWVRIEEFVRSTWGGCGRPEHDRGMLANAFVAKAVLGLPTTVGLIERLAMDRALRRICGFPMWKKLPDESTFSRAFAEFAEAGLAERTHAALVKDTLWDRLIGHISRDGTAIEAREKPAKKVGMPKPAPTEKKKRGRPQKGQIREVKPGKLEQQQGKPLAQLLRELPRDCDQGSKCNAQGYKNSWNGYKLHLDTALRHTGERAAFQRFDARQSCGDTAVPDDGGTSNELLRPDGRGLLQQRVTREQPQPWACAVDRP